MKDQAEIEAFLRVLDPEDNATGGGTASAVAGAMAGALAAMVARLSVGKKGLEPEEFYQKLAAEAETLSSRLFTGGREDALAFDGIVQAMRLPKETDAQKAARREALAAATLKAAETPLANAKRCARVLELCRLLGGRSNPNAASDLECAGHLARAGLLGCLANVDINLPGIKDEAAAARITKRAGELRRLAEGG